MCRGFAPHASMGGAVVIDGLEMTGARSSNGDRTGAGLDSVASQEAMSV